MPVSPVGGHLGAAPPVPQTASSALGSLGSDAFLKLLVAQLRYQNPMEPTDATAMMQQTAQFTQVETLQQIASAQQQMLGMNQAVIAAGLVGQEVSAQTPEGSEITGVVDAIRFTPTGPVLDIGGREVPLVSITEVRGTATDAQGSPTVPEMSETV